MIFTRVTSRRDSLRSTTVAMGRLDDLVAKHLEERLLDPDRLKDVLSQVLDTYRSDSIGRASILPS